MAGRSVNIRSQHRSPELSEKEKQLISRYILRIAIPSSVALSLLTFIGGFLINEVARGNAFNQAYESASSKILDTASTAATAVGQVEALRARGEKLTEDAEKSVTDVNEALKKAQAALSRAMDLQKTLDQMQAEQAASIAQKLANDEAFITNVSSATSSSVVKLNSDIALLRQAIDAIKASSGIAAIRGTDPSVAKDEGAVPPYSGTHNIHQDFVSCPPGTFVSAIQGFVGGGGEVRQLRYACRAL